jgi:hypothetical protein
VDPRPSEEEMTDFLTAAERLAKIAAALAALGYIALRSHLNYLGISSMTSLGADRYLMETYALVYGGVVRSAFALAAAVPVALGGYLVILLLLRYSTTFRRIWSHRRRGVEKLSNSLPGLIVLSLSTCGLVALILSLETDVAVGSLAPGHLRHQGEWRFETSLLVCLLGFPLARYVVHSLALRSGPEVWPGLALGIWRLNLLVLAGWAFLVPLLFGQTAQSTSYTLARVTAKETKISACGLLVLETDKRLLLWQAVGHRGQVLSIPADQVATVNLGRALDLLNIARDGAQGPPGATFPDCRAAFP